MFPIDGEVLYTGALLQHSNKIMNTKKRQSIKTQMYCQIHQSVFLHFCNSKIHRCLILVLLHIMETDALYLLYLRIRCSLFNLI